jgi:hypothetical protein
LETLSNRDDIDFVIGTRYGEGVDIDKNWPLHLQVISKVARLLARPLTPLSDPMTGFFGTKRGVVSCCCFVFYCYWLLLHYFGLFPQMLFCFLQFTNSDLQFFSSFEEEKELAQLDSRLL